MKQTHQSSALDVSRETEDRLRTYASDVLKWTKSINLIAKSTESEIWERHVLDSLTLFGHLKASDSHVVDLGSGGGFPGLVLAIASREAMPQRCFGLVESDTRKAAFLKLMAGKFELAVSVHAERIENLAPQSADLVTARALSGLSDLLEMTSRHLKPEGRALFLKGALASQELREAQEDWEFGSRVLPTKDLSCIVEVWDIRKKRVNR